MRALFFVVSAWSLVACSSSEQAPAQEPTSAPVARPSEEECIKAANRRPRPREAPPSTIVVRHILVKHDASKNPADGVTRKRGEACLRAIEARDSVLGGTSFDDVLAKYSDEAGAASRGGSLGEIRREDVDPAFADTAFDLDRGQMSDVVETPFGFHLILRSE
ncbi:MAG: foldase [Polyangiaceae bacterium]|nr:foldase [Polyangiaceae bacterium]